VSKFPWHKLPTPLALLQLARFRDFLRKNNLHDTSQIPKRDNLPKPTPSPDNRNLVARTDDGSYNDLKHPEMGMVGTRLGRNIPLKDAKVDPKTLLTPNPHTVSLVLLKRDKFIPATILNLHAAAWIQFQTHDWFTHGNNQPDNNFLIPKNGSDDVLKVPKTLKDPSRNDENTEPATFINHVTHW